MVDLDVRGFEEILTGLLTGNCVRPFTLASADFHESRKRAAILKMGADICAGNPVDAEEVLAVQRREQWLMQLRHHQHSPRISYKDLTIDPIRRRLNYYVSLLASRQAEILELLYFEGCSQEVCADKLGITTRTVRRLRNEAIDELAELYGLVGGFANNGCPGADR